MKRLLSLILLIYGTAPSLSAQATLAEYEISSCLTDCRMVSEVISQKLSKKTLQIKIGTELNCIVNSTTPITCTLESDTLRITIQESQITRDTVYSQTVSTITKSVTVTQSSTLCDCFFHLDLTLTNCTSTPRVVLVNGNGLGSFQSTRPEIEKK